MSYYYNYYLGYEKDGKIYPLGPFDSTGSLFSVLWKSRSFASNLHDEFINLPEEKISDELRKHFEYEDYSGKKFISLRYLLADDLPEGDGIQRGFCLQSDIENYLGDNCDFGIEELAYNMLSSEQYALKAKHELSHGVPKPQKDCEGEEFPVYSCRDYEYFSFFNPNSEEYEASVIRLAFNMFEFSGIFKDKDVKKVVILNEG